MSTVQSPEIRFECPKCKRPMTGEASLTTEVITCPDCGEAFMPSPHRPAPSPAEIAAASARHRKLMENLGRTTTKSPADGLRQRAQFFTVLAAIIFVVGIIIGLMSVCAAIVGGAGNFLLAGVCIGASAMAYLIAQVIHIRASITEFK